jgi:hypothetical protein
MEPILKGNFKTTESWRTSALAFLCFVFFALLYSLTARADIQVTDEAAVLASGISLATQGDLSIDELAWLQGRQGITVGDWGRDGHLYAKYFPGNILASSIAYKLFAARNDEPFLWKVPPDLDRGRPPIDMAGSGRGARAALRVNAIFGASALAMLFLILRQQFELKTAIMAILAVGIGTDWWYQSRGFLSEVGAGALLISSMYCATRGRAWHSSLALGFSLWFRPTNIVALPVWAFSVWRRKRAVWWSVAGLVPGFLGLVLFNWLRFGSPVNFGYASEQFNANMALGLFGLLLSPGRSIFVYSPVLLLAIPGIPLLQGRQQSEAHDSQLALLGWRLDLGLTSVDPDRSSPRHSHCSSD